MSDLIRRQDAINAMYQLESEDIETYGCFIPEGFHANQAVEALKALPSAKPERKKGKWIEISWSELDSNVCCTSFSIQSAKCSICGKYHTTPYLYSLDYFPYCPNCGAEMERKR